MATTPKTVRTYDLNGTARDFTIPFEYLARKFVVVTLIGATRRELVLNTEFRFTGASLITTTKAWGPADNFDKIEIRRMTSASERLVDFADGSILRAYDLNTAQVQSLHIAEEARDLTADTIGVNNDGDLDARARKIVNVADAVNDGDAVNLRMQRQWAGSALNSANAAKASQDAAKASQDAAKGSENQTAQYLLSAQNSQLLAEGSARTATTQAGTATTKAQEAASSAAAAKASQDAAKVSETNAATSAGNALTQADRAKSEADKLGGMNAFAATLESVTSPWVTWKSGWGLSTYTLATDTLLGRSADKVDVTSTWLNTKNLYAVNQVKAKGTFFLQTDDQGNGHVINASGFTGVGATGFAWASGQHWTVKGLPYFNLQATANDQNLHIWMRGVDFSDRGVLYNQPDGSWILRTGNQRAWTFQADAKLLGQGQFHSRRTNPGLDANSYANLNFQAEAENGSVPGYGFHRSGQEAAALVYYNGALRVRNNGNAEYELVHNGSLMGWLANNMRYDGVGSVASLQNVSGNNYGGNATLGGGSLRYASHNSGAGPAPSGSWLNLGWSAANGVSVWLRYA